MQGQHIVFADRRLERGEPTRDEFGRECVPGPARHARQCRRRFNAHLDGSRLRLPAARGSAL